MEFNGDDKLSDTEIIKLSNERRKYIDINHVRVASKMYDYHCDVRLRVSEQIFRAHRSVLADASDYFAAMFGHEMRERDQPAVELCGVSARGFATMIHYFYHGHATISQSSVGDVLQAARFFHVDWLLTAARHCLVTCLAIIRFDMALQLADVHDLGDIRSDVFRYVGESFASLVADDACCVQLPFELISELLAEDHYVSASEGCVADAVMRWLEANDDSQNGERLLPLLRYPLLEREELAALPDSVHHTVPQLIVEAHEYHSCRAAHCVRTSAQTCARGERTVLALISAVDDAYGIQYRKPNSDVVATEDFDTSFMQATFEHASTAVLGNFLFTAGGYDRRSWCSSNVCHRYDPRSNTWDELPPMQDSRVSFALCASSQRLYSVVGVDHGIRNGVEGDTILASVESYNPLENRWHFETDLPLACFNTSAVADADGTLYVSGGISDDPEHEVPVAYLSVYTGNTWRRCSDMLTARQGHASAIHDGQVFVCGGRTAAVQDTAGFDECVTSEVYDTGTDQWTTLVDTPTGRIVSVAVLSPHLYALSVQPCRLHAIDLQTHELCESQPIDEYACSLAVLGVTLPASIFS